MAQPVDGIAWQIKKLKKEKRLEGVGPNKGGSSENPSTPSDNERRSNKI
jgi:hypothetical protein